LRQEFKQLGPDVVCLRRPFASTGTHSSTDHALDIECGRLARVEPRAESLRERVVAKATGVGAFAERLAFCQRRAALQEACVIQTKRVYEQVGPCLARPVTAGRDAVWRQLIGEVTRPMGAQCWRRRSSLLVLAQPAWRFEAHKPGSPARPLGATLPCTPIPQFPRWPSRTAGRGRRSR
jgi:hypothetical protein